MMKYAWTDSTSWYDNRVVVYGFLLIVTVVNVVNLILKIMLMKAERQIIEEGKVV